MDTKSLERFATQVRRDLLAAVEAQTTSVLATGSVARSERPGAVMKLEEDIATHGRAHVVDKVTYTWFNRIVALRFMDACGYTDVGVVSPAQGQTHGQPEILADAKRGNLDTVVVTSKYAADAIIGLLDGTRRSTDAEGEAYALLLTEYCRYWHKSMPFIFEPEGDYTELLVPTGLLADGAVLSRAREVLTQDVCADVEVIGWLYQFYISERKDEVFAGFKKNKKAGADEIPAATQLFTPHWIVRYLVENSLGRLWMLNRPTSRLVDQMDYYIAPVDEETNFLLISAPEELTVIDPACGSGHMLTYAFDLLYSIYEEEGYAPSEIPSLILIHNLHGTEIDPRAGALAAFALTMKARSKQRTFFNKQVEPRICVINPETFGPKELDFLVSKHECNQDQILFWNQFTEATEFGSLIRPNSSLTVRLAHHLESLSDHADIIHADIVDRASRVIAKARFLSARYAVVVGNPPYMGTKHLTPRVAAWIRQEYPRTRQDLYGCFIERATELTSPNGLVAMIVADTWLTIKSFEQFRRHLLESGTMSTAIHLRDISYHPDVFGANFAMVFSTRHSAHHMCSVVHLEPLDSDEKGARLRECIKDPSLPSVYQLDADELLAIPGAPIAYRMPHDLRVAFSKHAPLARRFNARQGLATAHNDRFIRFWWEIGRGNLEREATDPTSAALSNKKWFPCVKGGPATRWYGNHDSVINWYQNGRELREFPGANVSGWEAFFQPCVSWSLITSGAMAFRASPAGYVTDHASGFITSAKSEQLFPLLAILNSRWGREIFNGISPSLNRNVGMVATAPVSDYLLGSSEVTRLATELTRLAKAGWDARETSVDYKGWTDGPRNVRLGQVVEDANLAAISHRREMIRLEGELDAVIDAAMECDLPPVGHRRPEATEEIEMVTQLVAYAVGCMFGRYSLDEQGLILADQGATLQDYLAEVPSPSFRPDEDNVIPFVDDGWFEDDIVERLRQFLRTAFGAEHFEENLRFVEESLDVKTLRDYFITRAGKSKFYEDHVQRYKKRPIYWMFSSPKGSFNALIYMHRYNPSTVSTVLNEYLREYRAKLDVALSNAEQAAAGGASATVQKEADRLRKVLAELRDYEHDVLYPLATQQITIDLDDGVKTNYPRFYPALKKIPGLEAAE